MSKGSLARRLRRAEARTPLPEGVVIKGVFDVAQRGAETDSVVKIGLPADADRKVCERAVYKRLRAVGAVMGKVASKPRRTESSLLATLPDDD